MRLAIASLVVAACVVSSSANAQQDFRSGNFFLEGCREAASNVLTNENRFVAGLCHGVISGIIFSLDEKDFCTPRDATNQQRARVVYAFLQNNPGRTHEQFTGLAYEALIKAWPCNRAKP